jgi:hypothetical protein
MTHPVDPHGTHSPVQVAFTSPEWEAFHAEDRAAARAVCGLMLGIFIVGVVLYTIVALSVGT